MHSCGRREQCARNAGALHKFSAAYGPDPRFSPPPQKRKTRSGYPRLGQPSCVCQHPDGIIDLTALASKSGPRWTRVTEKDSSGAVVFNFDYNPCSTFTTMDSCSNVYICQETPDGTGSYKIADAGTEQIYIDTNEEIYTEVLPRLSWWVQWWQRGQHCRHHPHCSINFGTGVRLRDRSCDLEGLCPQDWLDIIPNYNKSFWVTLTVLIKDGFKFTISPCMKAVRKDYEPL